MPGIREMTLDLRPLTLAELLDRSFSTYKRHVWLFAGIMALPATVAMLMTVGFRLASQPPPPGTPPEQLLRFVVPVLIATFVFFVIYLVVYTFALGATTIAVSELYLGRDITIKSAYQRVGRTSIRLFLLCLFAFLRITGALLALMVVLGVIAVLLAFISPLLTFLAFMLGFFGSFAILVFMSVRYGVSVPVVVLEGTPAGAGLNRSVDLTQGHRGRVFLIMLCAVVITYATTAIFQGPFIIASLVTGPGTPASLVLSLLGAVVGSIGAMFSGPVMIIGLAFMYYDLRIRKEALDIHLLLEHADAVRSD
jgi:hypothetical protein